MAKRIDPKMYELPNWEYLQADSAGFLRCVKHFMSLLEDSGNKRSPTSDRKEI